MPRKNLSYTRKEFVAGKDSRLDINTYFAALLEDLRRGSRSRYLADLVGDKDVLVMGLYTRGVVYANVISEGLRIKRGRKTGGRVVTGTFSYCEEKGSKDVKLDSVNEGLLRRYGMCLFVDEAIDDYRENGYVNIELAKTLINCMDNDNIPENKEQIIRRGQMPFSLDNARFVIASMEDSTESPFSAITPYEILFEDAVNKGIVKSRDLGDGVSRFLRVKDAKGGIEFVKPGERYLVIADESLNGIGLFLKLREVNGANGRIATKEEILDQRAFSKFVNGGNKKILLLGDDERVRERLRDAKSDKNLYVIGSRP